MKIQKSTFVDSGVELDGSEFEECTFRRCRMIFKGTAAVSLVSCVFDDVKWEFQGPAALALEFIRAMTADNSDYGRTLIVNTFPTLKDWLKPEIAAQFIAEKTVDG